jgi:hypothetical protein
MRVPRGYRPCESEKTVLFNPRSECGSVSEIVNESGSESESDDRIKRFVHNTVGYPRLCSFGCRFWCLHSEPWYTDDEHVREIESLAKDIHTLRITVEKLAVRVKSWIDKKPKPKWTNKKPVPLKWAKRGRRKLRQRKQRK